MTKKTIVAFDVDKAVYIGNENDGVYFQTAQGNDGWYVTAVVNTASFVDDLVVDDGPYATRDVALAAGRDVAFDWCFTNGVSFDANDE